MDSHATTQQEEQEFQRITNVSRETFDHYQTWYNLLTHWNKKINLVSPHTVNNYWLRHALDSWQITPHLPIQGATVLDMGSGAGFPGLAAAIHYKDIPNSHVYLIESNGKKCNFLRAVIRELSLPATAIQTRAESVPDTLENKDFDIITARAFAPMPKLLGYSAPYWSLTTQGIFPKGKNWQEEVEAANENWKFDLNPTPSQTDEEARILLVTNLKKED